MLKKLLTLAWAMLFLTPGCSIAQSQSLTWTLQSVVNFFLSFFPSFF